MPPTDLGVAVVTTATESEAEGLARAALEARLSACVQISPIKSYFQWEGVLREESEFALRFKIRRGDFDAFAAMIRSLHSYETPEIIMLAIDAGDRAYLDWVRDATSR